MAQAFSVSQAKLILQLTSSSTTAALHSVNDAAMGKRQVFSVLWWRLVGMLWLWRLGVEQREEMPQMRDEEVVRHGCGEWCALDEAAPEPSRGQRGQFAARSVGSYAGQCGVSAPSARARRSSTYQDCRTGGSISCRVRRANQAHRRCPITPPRYGSDAGCTCVSYGRKRSTKNL